MINYESWKEPIIDTEYVLPKTMEEMKLEADGFSELNPKVKREGKVYKSLDGGWDCIVELKNKILIRQPNSPKKKSCQR